MNEQIERLRADVTEAASHNMPLILARADDVKATLSALDEAVELLRQVENEFGCSIEQYNRNGPDFTHKDGTEVFHVSVLLDREELIGRARNFLARYEGRV